MAKKSKIPRLIGELKKPIDITVNGKQIPQVTRINGDKEWGFVYQFRKDNKIHRTCEPLWHDEFSHNKRNDLPRFNDKRVSRTEGEVIIREYFGGGWWTVKTTEGKETKVHFYNLKAQ